MNTIQSFLPVKPRFGLSKKQQAALNRLNAQIYERDLRASNKDLFGLIQLLKMEKKPNRKVVGKLIVEQLQAMSQQATSPRAVGDAMRMLGKAEHFLSMYFEGKTLPKPVFQAFMDVKRKLYGLSM